MNTKNISKDTAYTAALARILAHIKDYNEARLIFMYNLGKEMDALLKSSRGEAYGKGIVQQIVLALQQHAAIKLSANTLYNAHTFYRTFTEDNIKAMVAAGCSFRTAERISRIRSNKVVFDAVMVAIRESRVQFTPAELEKVYQTFGTADARMTCKAKKETMTIQYALLCIITNQLNSTLFPTIAAADHAHAAQKNENDWIVVTVHMPAV